MIKREMAKAVVDVPMPNLMVLALVSTCEPQFILTPSIISETIHFYDTGPPHERLPIFLRQHALLL